jgi:hypothetical protein
MAVKESNHKLRMFFPGQAFLSYDKEPGEFKQSRSNGCLGSSDFAALKKHISLEKILQSIPPKSGSKINLKNSSKKLGRGSAKDNNFESQLENRTKTGLKSNDYQHQDMGSPITPSRVFPLRTEHGNSM